MITITLAPCPGVDKPFAAVTKETVALVGADVPDGLQLALFDGAGTCVAIGDVAGGKAELDLDTQEAVDATAPVGPGEAVSVWLVVGDKDTHIATIPCRLIRNLIDDEATHPHIPAERYPTISELNAWLEEAGEIAGNVTSGATRAEQAATRASQHASDAAGSSISAAKSYQQSEDARKAADSAAQVARDARENAQLQQQQATAAAGKANGYRQQAENAQRLAARAQEAAEAAQQAAEEAQSAADGFASDAAQSAQKADVKADEANQAAADAGSASSDAQTAKVAAENAKTAAEAAKADAQAAKQAAEIAKSGAETAKTNAETAAGEAATSATQAAASATAAQAAADGLEEAQEAAGKWLLDGNPDFPIDLCDGPFYHCKLKAGSVEKSNMIYGGGTCFFLATNNSWYPTIIYDKDLNRVLPDVEMIWQRGAYLHENVVIVMRDRSFCVYDRMTQKLTISVTMPEGYNLSNGLYGAVFRNPKSGHWVAAAYKNVDNKNIFYAIVYDDAFVQQGDPVEMPDVYNIKQVGLTKNFVGGWGVRTSGWSDKGVTTNYGSFGYFGADDLFHFFVDDADKPIMCGCPVNQLADTTKTVATSNFAGVLQHTPQNALCVHLGAIVWKQGADAEDGTPTMVRDRVGLNYNSLTSRLDVLPLSTRNDEIGYCIVTKKNDYEVDCRSGVTSYGTYFAKVLSWQPPVWGSKYSIFGGGYYLGSHFTIIKDRFYM